MLASYVPNPYSDTTFWEFFLVLFQRIGYFLMGKGELSLASDELQMAVLASVAISGALVGSFLVLKRMTMLANALSHTILLGIVLVFLINPSDDLYYNIPLFLVASVLVGAATAFLTEFLNSTLNLQVDASIGLTFTSLFALGIVLITVLTRNAHIGTEVVMGNVDALQREDLYWALGIALFNAIFIYLFFKEYLITTFDSGLAQVIGFSPALFSYLLMGQTSITVVSGFRAVGVLMVLALLTAPTLIARQLTHRFKRLILLACLIGILTALIGVALSRHLLSVYGIALSTGGVTVCVISAFYLITIILTRLYKQSYVSPHTSS